MPHYGMAGDFEGLEKKLDEMASAFRGLDDWIVVSNYDCDGISAAAILAKTLQRLKKQFKVVMLKQLYKESLLEIRENNKPLFFTSHKNNY